MPPSSSQQYEDVNLSQCTLSALPPAISVHEPYDVLHRLLQLLPVEYLDKDRRDQNRVPEDLIILIVRTARVLIFSEPNVVHVDGPTVVCGDLHGQFYDLINIFCRRPPHGGGPFLHFMEQRRQRIAAMQQASASSAAEPVLKKSRVDEVLFPGSDPSGGDSGAGAQQSKLLHKYVFLGDYVDRGCRGIEVMLTLLCLKIISPSTVVLLRGNHEDEHVASLYGFFDECKRRYSLRLFKIFCDLFRCLPVAAVISNAIFCVHGGISPEMRVLQDIPDARPCNVPHDGIVCDLLWADPEVHLPLHSDGLFAASPRNVSYVFSPDALQQFLDDNDLDLVVRAHQVVQEGFQFFPPGARKLVTVFGATNYCDEFLNKGALLEVKEDLTCSILTLEPPSEEQRRMLRLLRDPAQPSSL